MDYAPATMQQTIPTDYRIVVNALLQSYRQILNTAWNVRSISKNTKTRSCLLFHVHTCSMSFTLRWSLKVFKLSFQNNPNFLRISLHWFYASHVYFCLKKISKIQEMWDLGIDLGSQTICFSHQITFLYSFHFTNFLFSIMRWTTVQLYSTNVDVQQLYIFH